MRQTTLTLSAGNGHRGVDRYLLTRGIYPCLSGYRGVAVPRHDVSRLRARASRSLTAKQIPFED